MSAVSKFQIAGAEQRKARSAKLVLVRFADSWHSRRAKPTSDDERLDVTAEVDRCGGVVDLVRQDGQLVVSPLSNREPMQLLEEWLRWRSSGALQNDTRRSFLK